MVGHEDVGADEPDGGGFPGLGQEGVGLGVREPRCAVLGADSKEDNCWCVRCGVDGLARTFAFGARVEHVVLLRPVGMEE